MLRMELGLSESYDFVNTLEDERNTTNFRILVDYITSFAWSWVHNLQFFRLDVARPTFVSQLFFISQQLSVVADSLEELRSALDSESLGPAKRRTLQISFAAHPPMILEDILLWVHRFASEEGPRILQQGSKFVLMQRFLPEVVQLSVLASGAARPVNQIMLPRSYLAEKVQTALRDLSEELEALRTLATPITHVITEEPEHG
jgi:hypothetical protein